MWRGFFLAFGVTLVVLGAECLVLEKVVQADSHPPPTPTAIGYMQAPVAGGSRDYVPPDWAPWSLLGAGAVVILYSFTIPKRVSGG